MFKSVLKIGALGLIVVVVMISLAFSSSQLSKVKCSDLVIIIPDDSPRFIDEDQIKGLVKKADSKLFDQKLDDINTEKLEQALKKETAIKNVEVYQRVVGSSMDFKGRLMVEVEQRNPVVRVRNGKEDFYMDKDGVKIPANDRFTAKVLLVNGHCDAGYVRKELLPLINYIDKSEFWKAQIEQMYVDNSGEITMAPLVGDQLIEFGDASDYRVKLRNLKALYEQAFPKKGWDYYSTINLKYTNQVVCTKK
ncbi:MAG TPA: hypothetical protein VKA27_12575 [Sunxiuqinia sp.]|nr:hypothetical protein [Sunxiuqinia sp.]